MTPNKPTHFVTPRGLEMLQISFAETQQKLQDITTVLDDVKGDSSNPDENAAVEEAVRERGILQVVFNQLSDHLQHARLFHPVKDGRFDENGLVTFGCRIGLRSEDGGLRLFDIVGEHESDIKAGKISYQAPLIRGAWGKEVGDEIEWEINGSPVYFEIDSVELSDWAKN